MANLYGTPVPTMTTISSQGDERVDKNRSHSPLLAVRGKNERAHNDEVVYRSPLLMPVKTIRRKSIQVTFGEWDGIADVKASKLDFLKRRR